MVQMQLPPAPIIIEPIGHVGLLLDLTHHQAASDGMNSSSRKKKSIPWPGVIPLQQLLNFARLSRFPKLLLRKRFHESRGDLCPGLRRNHVPHLGLTLGIVMPSGILVTGMHLDGKFFRGKDKLDQQRQRVTALQPSLADPQPAIREEGLQPFRAPNLFEKPGS
jgi:hypothetical protein